MLNEKLRPFYDAVNVAIGSVGKNATKIADQVIQDAFPETSEAADREGADRMLRDGVIKHLRKMLANGPINQADFSDISPDFKRYVDRLHSHSHYVPITDEYEHVSRLIGNLEWLDSARKFKRMKGEETLAEAAALDDLYEAITRKLAAEKAG